ncbi:hypothetical protein H6F32_09165 [Anabaena sp. FACHB-1237]|uniref:hypothetical protein n=1 Tax=Anabaena sp. FACHB-1237 TaxID=2692769 RepID=UPI00168019CB|nr:hypothetical protein [Anabaena sp. FACHB-1237]MBD2137754.1 hypothetical protein [Anabaena sp. FACHB-1237]
MGRERNTDYQGRANYIASKCGKDGKWKLYIIAAEGDKTEYKYFNALTTKYEEDFHSSNIHVEFIDREEEKAGNSVLRIIFRINISKKDQQFVKSYGISFIKIIGNHLLDK